MSQNHMDSQAHSNVDSQTHSKHIKKHTRVKVITSNYIQLILTKHEKVGCTTSKRHTEHQMRLRLGNLHHTIYESQQEGSTYPINLIQADSKSPRTDSLDFTPCALVIYFLLFLYYIILSCNSSSFIIITYEKGWVVIVII